ncbi:MAG: ABC transporter ATP-binding protein [Candidatus Aminicenantes bacterium]|nr:ABC transporter ATP-binding protein [Candidatus Aminicenantes bacterium]
MSRLPDPKDFSKPAVALEEVGIRFLLSPPRPASLRHDGLRALRALGRRRKEEFWALRNIDLEIKPGEIFGVVGGNGAGKSTLLKVMTGIYPATNGRVRIHGTLAPLIELGAAFNPELTGAENIFLSGSIHRVPRREIRRRFDEIVDFSGIREFLNVPVKNYSSGMFIRLAFSIIIFFQPEIVLIDEVFSVGDEAFQKKSFEKILSFRERGAAIVLVSHDLNLIARIAGRAAVLSRGRLAYLGPAAEAVAHYRKFLLEGEGLDAVRSGRESSPALLQNSRRWGDRRVEITSVVFVGEDGLPRTSFRTGEYFEARLSYVSRLGPQEKRPVFGVALITAYQMLVYGPNTLEAEGISAAPQDPLPSRGVVRFIVPSLPLFAGNYLFSASVYDPTLSIAHDHHDQMYGFHVDDSGAKEFGCVRIGCRWGIEPD